MPIDMRGVDSVLSVTSEGNGRRALERNSDRIDGDLSSVWHRGCSTGHCHCGSAIDSPVDAFEDVTGFGEDDKAGLNRAGFAGG